ncbi:MAG: lipoyl synthase [Clostridiales Family XIII bacterium]|jgi:lipoic acid synthetase|nr:lipoyl synthase [Clostridiales Family XIII bacterium]
MAESIGRKPAWLKKTWRKTDGMCAVEGLVKELGLNTVCREASCPNLSECFGRGIATFMILGANCTRSCGFCGVTHGGPAPVDPDEPTRVGEAVKRLGLGYAVITSVTRDDLPDGGAAQFAETVRETKRLSPGTKIETLIPDFGGSEAALELVARARPDVISHNMETVAELYEKVRPQADYTRSLDIVRRVGLCGEGIKSKSGVMVGVGETDVQMHGLFDDLASAGCAFLTIGQYLRPSPANIPVEAYIEPEVFDRWSKEAKERGFEFVASAPFARSSYHAEEAIAGK